MGSSAQISSGAIRCSFEPVPEKVSEFRMQCTSGSGSCGEGWLGSRMFLAAQIPGQVRFRKVSAQIPVGELLG